MNWPQSIWVCAHLDPRQLRDVPHAMNMILLANKLLCREHQTIEARHDAKRR